MPKTLYFLEKKIGKIALGAPPPDNPFCCSHISYCCSHLLLYLSTNAWF